MYYNDIQVDIVKEIHTKRDTHLLNGFKLNNFKGYITKAFQRRFRQELINGVIDQECLIISKKLLNI